MEIGEDLGPKIWGRKTFGGGGKVVRGDLKD